MSCKIQNLCASKCNSTNYEDRIPAKPSLSFCHGDTYSIDHLRIDFPFLRISQMLCLPLIPVFRRKGKCVAVGILRLPPSQRKQVTCLQLCCTKRCRCLDRGSENLMP